MLFLIFKYLIVFKYLKKCFGDQLKLFHSQRIHKSAVVDISFQNSFKVRKHCSTKGYCLLNYDDSPLAASQLLSLSENVRYSLTLTRGVWKHDSWGDCPFPDVQAGVVLISEISDTSNPLSISYIRKAWAIRIFLSMSKLSWMKPFRLKNGKQLFKSDPPFLNKTTSKEYQISSPTTSLWAQYALSETVCLESFTAIRKLIHSSRPSLLSKWLNPRTLLDVPWVSLAIQGEVFPWKATNTPNSWKSFEREISLNISIRTVVPVSNQRHPVHDVYSANPTVSEKAELATRHRNPSILDVLDELILLSPESQLNNQEDSTPASRVNMNEFFQPDTQPFQDNPMEIQYYFPCVNGAPLLHAPPDSPPLPITQNLKCTSDDHGLLTAVLGSSAAREMWRLYTSVPVNASDSSGILSEGINSGGYGRSVMMDLRVIDSRALNVKAVISVRNRHLQEEAIVTLTQPIPHFLEPLLDSAQMSTFQSYPRTFLRSSRLKDEVGFEMTNECLSIEENQGNLNNVCMSAEGSTASLSWTLSLPPNSEAVVELFFSKRFLMRDVQATDASRGLDFPPPLGVVQIHDPRNLSITESCSSASNPECVGMVFSLDDELKYYVIGAPMSGIVTMPFVDASMPFNVITLVTTCLALLFGTMMNTLGRKSSRNIKKESEGVIVKRALWQKLYISLKSKFRS